MSRDREIATARRLAVGMSEREARDILAHSRDFGFIEVYAAMIVTGEAR